MPTLAQLRTSFDASAVEARNDVDYRGDGFRLTIPAGYRYAKLQAPAMLLATRGDGATTINVLRHEVGDVDTEGLLRDMLAGMKKKNATYEFGPLEGGRTWFRVTKNGVPLRGLLRFEVRDERLWQLTLTEPASGEDAALLRIAQGWMVD